jgi:hypothetical protein
VLGVRRARQGVALAAVGGEDDPALVVHRHHGAFVAGHAIELGVDGRRVAQPGHHGLHGGAGGALGGGVLGGADAAEEQEAQHHRADLDQPGQVDAERQGRGAPHG